MSDSPLLSFAIGSLAARRSNGQLAGITASFLNRRNQPSIDVNSLISVIQQMEAHIAQQGTQIGRNDAYIADLQREVSELRAFCRKVEADRDRLLDWAEKAEEELKRWRSGA